MSVAACVRRVSAGVDAYLLAPQPNAAGRLGLFRIVYCVFYLWELSFQHAALLGDNPIQQQRLLVLDPFPSNPSPASFEVLESGLVMGLVLLLLGWRVRVLTPVVLVLGGLLNAYWNAMDVEHGDIFMVYLIPLCVLAGGTRWGDRFALDALHRPVADGEAASGIYALPARAILVLLAAYFVSAGLCKVVPPGTWLRFSQLLGCLALHKNVEAAIDGLPLNPLAPFIAETPWVYNCSQVGTLLFESTFFLALVNPRLRRLYLSVALVFHAILALWFVVTFTSILIVYAMFVDWEALWGPIYRRLPRPARVPPVLMTAAALAVALFVAVGWNTTTWIRQTVNLHGLIDWRTIWWPVLPMALIGLLAALAGPVWPRRV